MKKLNYSTQKKTKKSIEEELKENKEERISGVEEGIRDEAELWVIAENEEILFENFIT